MSKSWLDENLGHKTQFLLSPLIFNFVRKFFEKFMNHKWPFFDCFGHFFAIFMIIFHETEVQMVILRCLVSLNLNWIKSYYIILVKKFFFPCLKMHHFRAILPKWVLRPQKKISCHIFKMAILTKFFDDLMNHIAKGQLISKADWRVIDSPKKRTD